MPDDNVIRLPLPRRAPVDVSWATLCVGNPREAARRLLAECPPDGEIYWHWKNGRPCGCAACIAASEPLLHGDLRGWVRPTLPRLTDKRTGPLATHAAELVRLGLHGSERLRNGRA